MLQENWMSMWTSSLCCGLTSVTTRRYFRGWVCCVGLRNSRFFTKEVEHWLFTDCSPGSMCSEFFYFQNHSAFSLQAAQTLPQPQLSSHMMTLKVCPKDPLPTVPVPLLPSKPNYHEGVGFVLVTCPLNEEHSGWP